MGNANSGRLISIELVQRVERLLKHLPQSQVADQLGIDLGTVQKIQRNEHPQQAKLRSTRRCPGCGGKVLTAGCLKCAVDGNADGLRAELIDERGRDWEQAVDEVMADRVFVEGLGIFPPFEPEKHSPDKPRARAA